MIVQDLFRREFASCDVGLGNRPSGRLRVARVNVGATWVRSHDFQPGFVRAIFKLDSFARFSSWVRSRDFKTGFHSLLATPI